MHPLFEAAKRAGLSLYGRPDPENPHHGLVWRDEESIIYVTRASIPKGDPGEDADPSGEAYPLVDDYEYQFYPSTGEGKDVSGERVLDLIPDTDQRIYLYEPNCGIRVIV